MKAKECILYNLAKAYQAGNRIWSRAMSSYGLTSVQGVVLNFLYEGDGITSRELGSRIMLDSATLTGILDRLEKTGLVTRSPHPTDRRSIIVRLSEKGKRLAGETHREIEKMNHVFLDCLTRKERDNLKEMLGKIIKNSAIAIEKI